MPYYFNHKMTLDMLGIVPRLLPCRAADRFVPDAGEAAGLINPRTRAIVLVTPNNPTGACYDPGSIEAFYALASRRRIALILDETYRDFLPAGAGPAHGVFTDPSWPGAMIHLYSFSKAYSLTGYRVGALVASAGFVRQAAKIMDCLVICAPAVGQIAARYGIENLGEWRKGKRELLRRRVDAFSREIAGCGSGFEIASIGAFFAYMRHPFAGETAGAVARRLAGHGLLCLPGGTFGPDQDQFLRFAFANVEESVMPAVARRLKIMTD